mgnify:FL=1
MATQRTGTQILQSARYLAGDDDSANYGVSATMALDVLNGILRVWSDSVDNRKKRISATTSGLTFAAGDVYKEVTAGVDAASFASVHPSSSASINTPLAPALEYLSPDEMAALIDDAGAGTSSATRQSSGDWQYWSYEKTADLQDRFRVFVWPPLNRTAYLTAVVPVQLEIAAISDTPDVSPADADHIAHLLAWEIASFNEMPENWTNRLLARVPEEVVRIIRGRAVRMTQQAGSIRSVED